MMIAVTSFQWDASYITCKELAFCYCLGSRSKISRLFRVPFIDGSGASEILRRNRKFSAEFESLAQIDRELKDPNSKITKEGD